MIGNVTNQHETIQDGKETIVYVDIYEKGNSVGFAEVARNAWNNRKLKESMPANKPRQSEEHTDQKLVSSQALHRKRGEIKFEGLNMVVKLDDHCLGPDSKNNGLRSMYHLRFDNLLCSCGNMCFVCGIFPVFVAGVQHSCKRKQ